MARPKMTLTPEQQAERERRRKARAIAYNHKPENRAKVLGYYKAYYRRPKIRNKKLAYAKTYYRTIQRPKLKKLRLARLRETIRQIETEIQVGQKNSRRKNGQRGA